MRRVDARRLVFLDESGANVAMGRSQAWIPKGEFWAIPRHELGNNATMIGPSDAIAGSRWARCSSRRIESASCGGFERGCCAVFVRGTSLFWTTHRRTRIIALSRLRSRGVSIRYLPPYSPAFNPIGPAWSLIKKAFGPAHRGHAKLSNASRRMLNDSCDRSIAFVGRNMRDIASTQVISGLISRSC